MEKATRIEGNASVEIQISDGQIEQARFRVPDFRGFEKMLQGRSIDHVPSLISRICGLCSIAHYITALTAIERALGVEVPKSVTALRQVAVFGEWISSHSLSYFYMTLPDTLVGTPEVFNLLEQRPGLAEDAQRLRKAGQEICRHIGKRAIHPVAFALGGFLTPAFAVQHINHNNASCQLKDRTGRRATVRRARVCAKL